MKREGSQYAQCMISNVKLSISSLAQAKLTANFLQLHGDVKYKNTGLIEFKVKKARSDEEATLFVLGFVPIVRSCVHDRKAMQTSHH